MLFLLSLSIPVVLILIGAFAKKLVRGTEWVRSDFFLGVELSLAALASCLVMFVEMATSGNQQMLQDKSFGAGVFSILNLFLLFYVMALHQDWEKKDHDPTGQKVWLGLASNGIGVVLMMCFVALVKGAP